MKNLSQTFKSKSVLALGSLTIIFSLVSGSENISHETSFARKAPDAEALLEKNKNKTRADKALKKYESASTAEQAILAQAISSTLKDLKRSGLSYPDAAKEIMDELSNHELRNLPTLSKIQLIKALTDKGMPKGSKFTALKKIYSYTNEDIEFSRWDAENKRNLAYTLKNDPYLIKARKEWRSLDKDQKKEVLQYILDKTIEEYDDGLNLRDVRLKTKKMKGNTLGEYYWFGNNLYISESVIRNGNFTQAAEVTIHEGIHALHDQLLEKLKRGKLKESHDLYRQTLLIGNTVGRSSYISADKNYTGYKNTPTERHAFEIGAIGKVVGRGQGYDIGYYDRHLQDEENKFNNYMNDRASSFSLKRIEIQTYHIMFSP
jgi:hypothetical protein